MRILSILPVCGVVVAWFTCAMLLAEDVSPVESSEVLSAAQHTATKKEMFSIKSDPFGLIWNRLKPALDADNFQVINQGVLQLETLMVSAGVRSLDDYALVLVAKGEHQLASRNRDTAHFYLRKAYQLSPESPVVLYRSLNLASETGYRSKLAQWRRIIASALRTPELLFQVPVVLIYPLLWAATLGLFCALALLFSLRTDEILRRVARILPKRSRGYLTPLVVILCLVAPLSLGPLWTVAMWTLILFVCLPRYRWLGMIGGTVLAIWGFVIPLKENISLWLQDPAVKIMLRLAISSHGPQDIQELEGLASRRLGSDGLVYYLLGDLSRRYGMYEEAEEYFAKVGPSLASDPRIPAQLALITFARGDNERAKELFLEAEEKGLESAPLYYNLSKVYFELLDTKSSREAITKARRIDPSLVAQFEKREETLGLRASSSFSGFEVPVLQLFRSSLVPMPGAREHYTEVAEKLMWPFSPFGIAVVGVALFLCFFAVSPEKQRRLETYYLGYTVPAAQRRLTSLIPGGGFAVSGRPVWCFLGVSAVALSLFPLLGWPNEVVELFTVFPSASQVAFVIASVVFSIVYVASFLGKKESE
ncbi:MAG: tetratricopeptide repeat protein [Bdellovibrionales bacterium]|nr:tetratricopeptide repeat protein [Bdellovibrionales bacterium]